MPNSRHLHGAGRLRQTAFALAGLALVACTTSPDRLPDVAAAPPSGDPIAVALIERWFEQTHGFDALEGYRVQGDGPAIGFALARRWGPDGDGAEIFIRTTEPKNLEMFFLIRYEPGIGSEVRSSVGRLPNSVFAPFGGRRRGERVSWVPPGVWLDRGDPSSLAQEVTTPPVVPPNFTHTLLADDVVAEQPCTVVESRALQPNRWFTHAVLYLSKQTGVALRTVYFRGDEELRRVRVAPNELIEHESGFTPRVRTIETRDGTIARIELGDLTVDPELPDRVFSDRSLKRGRSPAY